MRRIIVLALAATLVAAPASAQEANQVDPAEAASNAEAGPEAALNDVALPPTDEAVTVAPAPVEPVYEPETAPARDDDDDFPWGLIGLVGLVGLLGRVRS